MVSVPSSVNSVFMCIYYTLQSPALRFISRPHMNAPPTSSSSAGSQPITPTTMWPLLWTTLAKRQSAGRWTIRVTSPMWAVVGSTRTMCMLWAQSATATSANPSISRPVSTKRKSDSCNCLLVQHCAVALVDLFHLMPSSSLFPIEREDRSWLLHKHSHHNLGLCCRSFVIQCQGWREQRRNLPLLLRKQYLWNHQCAMWRTAQRVDCCLQRQLLHWQTVGRSCSDRCVLGPSWNEKSSLPGQW